MSQYWLNKCCQCFKKNEHSTEIYKHNFITKITEFQASFWQKLTKNKNKKKKNCAEFVYHTTRKCALLGCQRWLAERLSSAKRSKRRHDSSLWTEERLPQREHGLLNHTWNRVRFLKDGKTCYILGKWFWKVKILMLSQNKLESSTTISWKWFNDSWFCLWTREQPEWPPQAPFKCSFCDLFSFFFAINKKRRENKGSKVNLEEFLRSTWH